MRILSKPG